MKNEKKYHILFADNSEMINEVMQFAFEMDSFTVDTEINREEIIKKISSIKYDLIIISLEFDALKICNISKESEQNQQTPILIISTSNDKEIKKKAKSKGVSGWIIKPFVPEKLVKSIRLFLKMNKLKSNNLI